MKRDMSSQLLFAPSGRETRSFLRARVVLLSTPPSRWSPAGSGGGLDPRLGSDLIVCSSCLVGLSQELWEQPKIRISLVGSSWGAHESFSKPCCTCARVTLGWTWDPERKWSHSKHTGRSSAGVGGLLRGWWTKEWTSGEHNLRPAVIRALWWPRLW